MGWVWRCFHSVKHLPSIQNVYNGCDYLLVNINTIIARISTCLENWIIIENLVHFSKAKIYDIFITMNHFSTNISTAGINQTNIYIYTNTHAIYWNTHDINNFISMSRLKSSLNILNAILYNIQSSIHEKFLWIIRQYVWWFWLDHRTFWKYHWTFHFKYLRKNFQMIKQSVWWLILNKSSDNLQNRWASADGFSWTLVQSTHEPCRYKIDPENWEFLSICIRLILIWELWNTPWRIREHLGPLVMILNKYCSENTWFCFCDCE